MRKNYPELMANPGPLTARVKRPNKDEAVSTFVSRFGTHVEPVGRPEGCEDVVVPAKLPKKPKKGKARKKDKKKKDKSHKKDKEHKDKGHKKKSRKRTRASEEGECSTGGKCSKT